MRKSTLSLLLSLALLTMMTGDVYANSPEADAPIVYTKANAAKWLARAEMYVKECDPNSERKLTLDTVLVLDNVLLGNEARANEILKGPISKDKSNLQLARMRYLLALILKGQSVEKSCHFIESLGVDSEMQKRLYQAAAGQLLGLYQKPHQCEDLLALCVEPQTLSVTKGKLIEYYIKTSQLEDAARLLQPIVLQGESKDEDGAELQKLRDSLKNAKTSEGTKQPKTTEANRRSPLYEGLAMWISAELPEGTGVEKLAYLENEADDETRALAYQKIAAMTNDQPKIQTLIKRACLQASLDATKKLPPKLTRYANLTMLAALYEEEGEQDQAKALLHEATDFLYAREKELKEKSKKLDDTGKILSMMSNLVERYGMAPLVCDLHIRLGEPNKAIRLAKTIDDDCLWMQLIESLGKALPASAIEKLIQTAPSPASKAAICLGVVDQITKELCVAPKTKTHSP